MTPNRRMTVTCAVACVLVSTAMYPLFDFSDWFYAGIGAAAVAAACGALTRLRVLPVPVCLAVSVLGQLYYLDVVFEARHCLLRFLPTPASIRFLWDLVSIGIYDAHKFAPPAEQATGLVLLAAAGIGITAVLTDLIAVRLRSTALAGLPLLVLFTVPVTMNAPSGWGTIVVFSLGTAGYLAMLSADGRERIRVWGRLVSLWRTGPLHELPLGPGRRGPRRAGESAGGGQGAGPDTRALAAVGRRVGFASVVLALSIPLILPGLHPGRPFATGPGIGGNAPGQGGAALPDALTQTLAQLRETHPTQVLTYTTSASPALQRDDAQYLHQWVLDTLGDPGTGWEVTSYYTGATQSTALPSPLGLTVFTAAQLVTTTVTTVAKGALTSSSAPTFLPMPYPASRVDVAGTWLTDPESMVFSAANDADVESYQVTSFAVDPTPEELEEAALPPLSALTADLQLPPAYRTPALEHIADLMTAGDHTEYEKVRALADWLSGNEFTYDDGAKSFDTPDGLLNFLNKTRKGVCVQSAYAMTVLTRLLGIPARMVQGYTAGSPAGKNRYVVKSSDAHVWTEVYFAGYGWIRFEPTPSGQGTATATNYMGPPTGTDQLNNGPPLPFTAAVRRRARRAPSRVRSGPGRCRRAAARSRRLGQQVGRVRLGRHPPRGAGGDRAGLRGHRDRGAPGAPRPVRSRRRAPAQARVPHRGGPGGGRGGRRPARVVPGPVPRRDRPAGRLGDGRHRVRRGLRGHAGRACDQPVRPAAVALGAGQGRREPGARRLARVPRRSGRPRRQRPAERAAADAGRPRHGGTA